VAEVRITALEDGVFYAVVTFVDGTEVGARPSDAIALALRTGAPIRGAEAVLDAAGIELPAEDDEPVSAEDEVQQFREFLDHVSPEDFGQ
jgi:bifunctional DNase/RNase